MNGGQHRQSTIVAFAFAFARLLARRCSSTACRFSRLGQLYRYGLCSYGLCSHGDYYACPAFRAPVNHIGDGLYSCGLYRYGLCSHGHYHVCPAFRAPVSYIGMAYVAMACIVMVYVVMA